jgi:hypothetical protein
MPQKKVRHCNDHIKEVINDKREAFKKFLSAGTIEVKIDYSNKNNIKRRNSWDTPVSSL